MKNLARDEKPRAFLTGASGFLGPHVVAALQAEGFDVFSSSTMLDDAEGLRRELSRGPWDLVFHLAGLSLPRECEADPARAYEINVVGTKTFANLVSDANLNGPFVFFSTAHVYDPDIDGVISETSRTKPQNVYGNSKLLAEKFLEDAATDLKFPVLILRLFNHAHKSQRPDFFLPAMYQTLVTAKARQSGTVKVPMGDPTLKRDFNSIQDFRGVVEKIIRHRDRVSGLETINLCSGQSRNLGDLVETLARRLGRQAKLQPLQERMRPGEPRVIRGDATRLAALIGAPPPVRTDAEFIELFLADLPMEGTVSI